MNHKPFRILIIDDDDSIRETLQVALTAEGYDVIVASDGAEGLMKVERDAPDLVILDLVMPKRSGFLIAERLNNYQGRRPSLIMMTGLLDEKHKQAAKACGVDAFVNKPFDIDSLLETVQKFLHSARDTAE